MKFFKKKFIPYARQNITDEDIKAVEEILKNEFITQGPVVNEFEKEIGNS